MEIERKYEAVDKYGDKHVFPSIGKMQQYMKERPLLFIDTNFTKTSVIKGVGKDAPRVTNEKGGSQSHSPYRLDLVDPKAILETSRVLSEGAEKYGEENWRLLPVKDHLNHLLVHVYAYLAGDKSDDHLSHAVCRALFALGTQLQEEEQQHAMVSN